MRTDLQITKYVNDNQITLTTQQVRVLFDNRERNKDLIANAHLALVLSVVQRFKTKETKQFSEVFSDGLLGLQQAIMGYDNDSNVDFPTYAKTVITNTIKQYINVESDLIRRPFSNRLGLEVPTAYQFSHYENDDTDSDFNRVLNTLTEKEPQYTNNEEILVKTILKSSKKDKYGQIVCDYLGLGLDKSKTQKEIANEYGVTRQRIEQIVNDTLKKLRTNEAFTNKLKEIYKID